MSLEIRLAQDYLFKQDPVQDRLIRRIGDCTLSPSNEYFASLVRSIIYQQLSRKAAKSIYEKLLIRSHGGLTPKKIIAFDDEAFKKIGISSKKRIYLISLSESFLSRQLRPNHFLKLDDESLIEMLCSIKGIGRWTAQMFLIFCLNRLDVFPGQDAGLRRSIHINYNLSKLPSGKTMVRISNKWIPYRTIGCWYLWQSINGQNAG